MIIPIELEQIEYHNDLTRVKEIVFSQNFRKQISHPDGIEYTNPLYSIVQHSKLNFLSNGLLLNPFNSRIFFWMDAGIYRFFNDLNLEQKLTGKSIPENKFYISINSFAFQDTDFQSKNKNVTWKGKIFF